MKQTTIEKQLLKLQDPLYSFALSMTADPEDARDLLQDTMLKVLDNKEKFAVDTNFKAWAFTMMRNIFINKYRRMVREQNYISARSEMYKTGLLDDFSAESPESACYLHEMESAVSKLGGDIQTSFTMHIMGFKYVEIADQLDVPIGTVKSRIHVARKKLKTELSR